MTRGLHRYTIHGPGRQFTPYGLTKGTTYYFRVRSLRGSKPSAYSSVVHFAPRTLEQPVEVMTYNLLQTTNDDKHEGNGIIAPWAQRLPKQVALIKAIEPDFLATQEGAKYTAPEVRQVDSLAAGLGAPYALDRTEIPPTELHYFRTGVNIIYNTSTYAPVGAGNHIDVGNARYAAYQEFRNLKTGARVLFIATHLLVGKGHADDLSRETETKNLIRFGSRLAHRRRIPVVYAGDFNSASTKDKNFTVDGAGVAMRGAFAADALSVAQQRTHATYDSANEYLRRAPHSDNDIDHIFAPPGVGVRSAGVEVHLRAGKFVGVIPSDHNPLVAELRYPY
jgi:endonuclease/exonuclease/phosphatase family metal-dependent hydrolase